MLSAMILDFLYSFHLEVWDTFKYSSIEDFQRSMSCMFSRKDVGYLASRVFNIGNESLSISS